MRLSEMFETERLAGHVADKNVRWQVHPRYPLAILNYTEKAAYEEAWDDVTLPARGLIYDILTQEVVARPFPKFFNYGQRGAAQIGLQDEVVVNDKLDGSLGILYPTPDGYAVATRGSFTSYQALHATELFQEKYAGFEPPAGHTALFEIIFPENRIVLNYGDLDELVLLGSVDIETGVVYPPHHVTYWSWLSAKQFETTTLAAALAQEPRENAEGLVVRSVATGEMLKIKQADYVALHRIVTGLSARVVWRHLWDGKPLDELVAPLPDEFHTWVLQVAEDLTSAIEQRERELIYTFTKVCDSFGSDSPPRKDFAAAVLRDHKEDAWAMFMLLDGKDIRPELWKKADPGVLTPAGREFTEDTA